MESEEEARERPFLHIFATANSSSKAMASEAAEASWPQLGPWRGGGGGISAVGSSLAHIMNTNTLLMLLQHHH